MMFVFKIDIFPWTSLYPRELLRIHVRISIQRKMGSRGRTIFQSHFWRSKVLTVILAVAGCLWRGVLQLLSQWSNGLYGSKEEEWMGEQKWARVLWHQNFLWHRRHFLQKNGFLTFRRGQRRWSEGVISRVWNTENYGRKFIMQLVFQEHLRSCYIWGEKHTKRDAMNIQEKAASVIWTVYRETSLLKKTREPTTDPPLLMSLGIPHAWNPNGVNGRQCQLTWSVRYLVTVKY